jgi:pimeloyl-ACP methyl ester carboxylesterase
MISLIAFRRGRSHGQQLDLGQPTGAICPPGSASGVAGARAAAGTSAQTRSPSAVLIVTGMGMRGELEDDLRSRTGRSFAAPVPVMVHRYGVARSGSLLRPCQQAVTRRLAARLRELSAQSSYCGTEPPDIIAHSFGAWLVGNALQQNPDIRVGLIIMAGSVLRPDFDWHSLISRGQAETVLNHYGSRDWWAFVSEFFIPDSGPAGFNGFAQCAGVFNHPEPGFRHLTFFQSEHIGEVHRALWQPFLSRPAAELPELAGPDVSRAWRPRPWLLRANLPRFLLLGCLVTGTAELLLHVARLMAGLLS